MGNGREIHINQNTLIHQKQIFRHMNCPKCKEPELRKKSGFDSPLSCQRCGGMWLESKNLPGFIENLKSSSPATGEDTSLNDDKTGLCPAGHGIMIRAKIGIDNPFFLEKCTTCGGIWFDNGEWLRVVNSDLTDKINEFWCKSWQSKQRQEKNRQNYLKTNKKLFGNELFDELMKLSELLKTHPEKGRAIALLQQEVLK
jgi:Zn-finger nucleic acid-binding protein